MARSLRTLLGRGGGDRTTATTDDRTTATDGVPHAHRSLASSMLLFGVRARADAIAKAVPGCSLPLPSGWSLSQSGDEEEFCYRGHDDHRATEPRTTELDPRFLPLGWSMVLDEEGCPTFVYEQMSTFHDPRGCPAGWRVLLDSETLELYFATDVEHSTTYTDPRGLPDGWELRSAPDADGGVYFADTRNKRTVWRDPRVGARAVDRVGWCAPRRKQALPPSLASRRALLGVSPRRCPPPPALHPLPPPLVHTQAEARSGSVCAAPERRRGECHRGRRPRRRARLQHLHCSAPR